MLYLIYRCPNKQLQNRTYDFNSIIYFLARRRLYFAGICVASERRKRGEKLQRVSPIQGLNSQIFESGAYRNQQRMCLAFGPKSKMRDIKNLGLRVTLRERGEGRE